MQQKFVIGLDYGTLSGRAILVDVSNGGIVAQAVKEYPHGVMDTTLPVGRAALPGGEVKLPPEWALQHPQDYLDVLCEAVPAVVRDAGVRPEQVIGLSMDFTACTPLPVKADGTPLCFLPEFERRPHAYVKLWKHHGAARQAEKIDAVLAARGLTEDPRFGGKVSSEILVPKIAQILEEDPEIYAAADKILEAVDWLGFLLTGRDRRTASMAGYKVWWTEQAGYPEQDFLRDIHPGLENLVEEKLSRDICPVGGKYGELTGEWAEKLGLMPGTAIGSGIIDAHAGLPGCGITRPGQMMLILGTSSVTLALSETPHAGNGTMGAVKGGVMPGYYGVESGLAGVGDIFGWFVDNCVPESYALAARSEGKNIHSYLTELAARLTPGESGLLALDWFSGNKTPFVDADLSGLILGLTLATRPEEIYRALLEATAFGTRRILEEFEAGGIAIDEVFACGGIVHKNPLLMQIYADVLGCEIRLSASEQTAALGAAMYAAVAAGGAAGGYDSLFDAARAMGHTLPQTYKPNAAGLAVYNELYGEYKRLGTHFGAENPVMKRLKVLRAGARQQ